MPFASFRSSITTGIIEAPERSAYAVMTSRPLERLAEANAAVIGAVIMGPEYSVTLINVDGIRLPGFHFTQRWKVNGMLAPELKPAIAMQTNQIGILRQAIPISIAPVVIRHP